MSLIGLDLNSSRARAVHGPAGSVPTALPLDECAPDLPLAVSLEGRQPRVGRVGTDLRRRAPHLACFDFLAHIGQNRVWEAGSHRFNADQALSLIFAQLGRFLKRSGETVVALPSYLTGEQVELIGVLAEQAHIRLLGSVPTAAAAAVAAAAVLPWSGLALVLDVDGAALSWSAVALSTEQARLVDVLANPRLNRAAWLNQMLDFVARRCVRLSRRDPRESPEAEQSLYDQLDSLLEHGARADGLIELNVRTPQWGQHLMLRPHEVQAACADLVKRTLHRFDELVSRTASQGPASAVLLTASAARLPGLTKALEARMQTAGSGQTMPPASDFGEGLLSDGLAASRVHVLSADAVARAVHELAGRIRRGEWPLGHYESAPLPGPKVADDPGPARLEFEGREHPLSGASFLLGRDPGCNLVFPGTRYPTVSARHCEILLDRAAYILRDRSRHGTLLNDQPVRQEERVALHPGDTIRLGPSGPVVRFLGQPASRSAVTV